MTAIHPTGFDARDRTDTDWWRGGVIYQIYPRSFQDSNDDGIGDIRGITMRMDYIASLGVDAIWISPFFRSPMKDFGYDVSDYCDIDPMFGTLDDFDELIAAAHARGIRVMIDLVLSHTSDQHPWFAESRASRDGPKSDWYVWADPRPDGTPPNNWLSIFGGSAWQWDSRREQYYLHNFLTSQPDLNLHTRAVQDALLEVTRFWLDRGVDGYRLDTINFYMHDPQLRDNPPLPLDQRIDTIAPSVNPYNHQLHLYSKNHPDNLGFLARFRALLDAYPGTAALGEVGDAQKGLEILGAYTAGTTGVHMCYAFELLWAEPLTPGRIRDVFAHVDAVAGDGWACWAYSNHDVPRHTTRWGLSAQGQRCHTALMMCLRGSVCLYQGEELGLSEAELAFDDLQDPYGIEFWPEFKGRDGCRTPMVWEATNTAGFSAAQPWLPVSADHMARNVAAQDGDPTSMLAFYRLALQLRRAHPALAKGAMDDVMADGTLLSFTRRHDGAQLRCLFNMGDDPVDTELGGSWQSVADALGGAAPDGGRLRLGGWGFAILARR
ncbi:MAG: alpha-amylase family glycosyl hydrolase [Marinibacterium sp.]|nr:alpha-amylase family glycosyl hydrolase [Marinibacterium sp.]